MCIHASCWCVILVCVHRLLCHMSKDLRHVIVTEYLLFAYSYFCHTLAFFFFWLQSWASAAMPCRDMEGCMLGSYVTWAGPWWTWFYYTGPVSQTASQSASFRKRLGESEDTHWETKPDWTAVRQVFPPVNHSPQNRSNDAGSLKRPAGWNWVQEDLMSHSLQRSRFLSIIISDMMTLQTAIELCRVLRDDHITGVNKTSITGTLWKVLIPD